MNKEFLLLLTDGKEKSDIVVNSNTLFWYLLLEANCREIREKRVTFDRELDLGNLTWAMEELYQHPPNVSVEKDPIERLPEYLQQLFRETESGGHNLKGGYDESKRRTVYYDTQTPEFCVTDIEDKLHPMLSTDVCLLRKIGIVPLIQIHCNPTRKLFSSNDYLTLLYKTEEGNRAVPARLVLCPKEQILAITTPQTPLLGLDDLFNKYNFWRDESDLCLRRFQEIQDYLDFKTDIDKQQTHQKQTDHFTKTSREFNCLHIELAKEARVMLYFSTDMRTFKQFSA